jgi:hypothetical protein
LNEAGKVIGSSYRYNGGSVQLGQSAWLYDGATNTNIGLIGPEHTRNDGGKYSQGSTLNEAGHVVGYSLFLSLQRRQHPVGTERLAI